MGLGNLFGRDPERRSTTSGPFSIKDAWDRDLWSGPATASGVVVTQENALRCNAIFAAVNFIADNVSMLPMDTYFRRNGERLPFRPKPAWVDQPDPDGLPRQAFLKQWLVSKLLSHGACVRILRDGADVVALQVMDPRRVERKRDESTGRIYYVVDGGRYRLERDDVIYDAEHIPAGGLMGVSRVDTLRETFGLAQALESYASTFFGNGSTMGGIVEVPGEIDAEQARQLQDAIEAGHKGLKKAHRPGVLSGGATWKATSVNPEDSQLLESREFAIADAGRAYRIPPAMLGSTKSGVQGYASREQDAVQLTTFTLLNYVNAIEGHLSRLLPREAFVKINVDGLTRAVLADRYAAYSQGIQAGFLSVNDIHRLEDMRPVEGGDEVRVPLANIGIAAASLSETQIRVQMFLQLVQSGVTPASAAETVGLPPMEHTGLPSVQLQNVLQVDEAGTLDEDSDPEDDPVEGSA